MAGRYENDDDSVVSDIIGPSSPVEASQSEPAFGTFPDTAPPATSHIYTNEYTYSPSHYQSPRNPISGSRRPSAIPSRLYTPSMQRTMQRAAILLSKPPSIGGEPGVDPKKDSSAARFAHLNVPCNIEMIDYSVEEATFRKLSNRELVDCLLGESKGGRPSWAKVRWINIGGISWDVIRALGIRYELHPLSLEAVLHNSRIAQSKTDYYGKHLFISILVHTLSDEQDGEPPHSQLPTFDNSGEVCLSPTAKEEDPEAGVPKSWLRRRITQTLSPDVLKAAQSQPRRQSGNPDIESGLGGEKNQSRNQTSEWEEIEAPWITSPGFDESEKQQQREGGGTWNTLQMFREKTKGLSARARAHAANMALVDELKKGERVNVDVRSIYLFLLRDGTFISIHQDPDPLFGLPIIKRLRQKDTLLRSASDASLLLQSVLDLIVDNALQIVDKYHEKILKLERDMLIKPKMTTVRFLHILSGDLTFHKQTLAPVRSLVYGLRRYDLDRCIALMDSRSPGDPDASKKAVGFMSHQAKVYLADVLDHMEYILISLDMFAGIAENLINFAFNTISYETNEVMRRLSLVTVIFFPLTFLTGYFGMNFYSMFSTEHHTDIFFWEIAIPVIIMVVTIFCWNDFVKFGHWMRKRLLRRKLVEWHTV